MRQRPARSGTLLDEAIRPANFAVARYWTELLGVGRYRGWYNAVAPNQHLAAHALEATMTTILIIVVLFLLLGGGGFYGYRRRW